MNKIDLLICNLQWKFKSLAGKFSWGGKAKRFAFKSLLTTTRNVLPLFLIKLSRSYLNFHWRWRWLDQIQATFLKKILLYSILLFFGDWTWDTSHTFFSRWSINQIKWKISHCVRSQLLHLTNVVVCLLCFQKIHKNLQKTPPNYYLPPQLSTLYNYHLRITKLVMSIELWQLKCSKVVLQT